MKIRHFLLPTILILSCLSVGAIHAEIGNSESVNFARWPAPSPDGSTLAFSWAGSIWTVPISGGQATRLTSSDGYDWVPIWSPDGEKIAFMSNRYGSEDLFVVDASGGTPERITFAANNDILSGWTPDGKSLIFSTRRGGQWPDNRAPYVVDLQDDRGSGPGAPRILVPCGGYGATVNPQGNTVAFAFGPGNGYRQGYQGTHKQDIWLYKPENGDFHRVTENRTENMEPQWSADGSRLYFRSELGGIGNLWTYVPSDESLIEITHVTGTGLWHPRIGGPAGAEIVAYEWGDAIYIQDIPEGSPREIRITAWLDENPNTPETLVRNSGASEYALSPDGAELAFVYRGEIFCVRTDGIGGTEAAQLTDHPARDWEIAWYPRGDALLFTSDRDGIEQFYRVTSDDPDRERLSVSRRFKVERIANIDESCSRAVFAPVQDSDELPDNDELTIAYIRKTGALWFMDGDGGHQRKLFDHWGTLDFSFSPDGRWIAYSRQDDDYNVDCFIAAVDPDDPDLPPCPTDGRQPFPGLTGTRAHDPSWENSEINITRHPDDDYLPVWSPDGSKIGFTSTRNRDNVDAYFVFLKLEDEERSINAWELQEEPLPALPEPVTESEETEEDTEDAEEETEDEPVEEEEAPFLVEIDFENIHYRARRLTSDPLNEVLWGFSPDGETIVFTSDSDGSSDIWQIKWTGEDAKALTNNAEPGEIIWHREADRIFYLAGGSIASNKPGGGDAQTHGFTARMTVFPYEERNYKFNETWRIQDMWFYDENFHGRDWDAIREEFEPIIQATRHYRDFNDAVNMMFGRLNTSHLSYRDAGQGPVGPETGYLGCGFTEDDEPGLLIEWVTPASPADHLEIGLEPGDRIVSINGFDVGGWGDAPIGNYWRALEGTYGREIEIGFIDSDGESADPVWTRLIPTDYWGWWAFEYEAWTAENLRIVDELSGGRLGYMHIRRMYEDTMERFEQDLYTVGHGREGFIIDVRWNSGGWTTDFLLSMLETRRHALTQPRDGNLGYPEDRTAFYTTTAPLAVLVNQWSFSNAEVFSHAIQQLGRGQLIGWTTAGGVISTGGTRLADGSYISLPRRGWWGIDPETGVIEYNLEGTGAVPEVMVDRLPPDIARGVEPQLEAAVEALMAELGIRP